MAMKVPEQPAVAICRTD